MAINQKITLDGAEEVQQQLAALGIAGERLATGLKSSLGSFSFGDATKSIAGLVAAVGAASAALFAMAKSSASTVDGLSNIATASGTTIENLSAMSAVLARAGVDTDDLGGTFKRVASVIEREWVQIVTSARKAAGEVAANNLTMRSSLVSLAKAQQELASANSEASALQISNSNNVEAAELRVIEARKNAGQITGVSSAELSRRKNLLSVDQAELALTQAIDKQREDAALARVRAEEKALAVAQRQIAVDAARKKSADIAANSIENLTRFVNNLASGVSDPNLVVNATAENLIKGIVASVGPGIEELKKFKVGLSDIGSATPSVSAVLERLADIFKNTNDVTLKTAIASKVFGQTVSQEFIESLSKGSAALREEKQRMEELGLIFTKVDEQTSKGFQSAINRLSSDVKIIGTQFGLLFQPAFTKVLDFLSGALEKNRTTILGWGAAIRDFAVPIIESFARVLAGTPDAAKDEWLLRYTRAIVTFGTSVGNAINNIVIPAFQGLIASGESIAAAINSFFGTNFTGVELLVGAWVLSILGFFRILGAAMLPFKAFFVAVFAEIALAMEVTVLGLLGRLGVIVGLFIALLATIKPTETGASDAEKARRELEKLNLSAEEFKRRSDEISRAEAAGQTIGSAKAQEQLSEFDKKIKQTSADLDAAKKKSTDLGSIGLGGTPGAAGAPVLAQQAAGQQAVTSANNMLAKINEIGAAFKKAGGDGQSFFQQAANGFTQLVPSVRDFEAGVQASTQAIDGRFRAAAGPLFLDVAKNLAFMNQKLQESGTFSQSGLGKVIDVNRQLELQSQATNNTISGGLGKVIDVQKQLSQGAVSEADRVREIQTAFARLDPSPLQRIKEGFNALPGAIAPVSPKLTELGGVSGTVLAAVQKAIDGVDVTGLIAKLEQAIAKAKELAAASPPGQSPTTPAPSSAVPLLGQPRGFDRVGDLASQNIEDRRNEFSATAQQIGTDAQTILERVKAFAAEVSAAIGTTFSSLSEGANAAVQAVVATFTGGGDLIGTVVLGAFQRAMDGARGLADQLSQSVQGVFAALQAAIGGISSQIDSAIAAVISKLEAAVEKARQLAAQAQAAAAGGGGGAGFAGGGFVWGAGTSTSDSIPARLSRGEFVQRAKAVAYYGPQFMAALNALRIPRDLLRGFSMGGLVDGLARSLSPLHLPGFADGGLVDGLVASLPSPTGRHLGTLMLADAAGRPVGTVRPDGEESAANLARYVTLSRIRSMGVRPSSVR